MPELIAVLVIVGVLAAVGAPRLLTSGHDTTRLFHETLAALRYAQSASLAMQRTVCVTVAPSSITLRYVGTYGVTNCGDPSATGLTPPAGGPSPYQVSASGSAAFTSGTGTFSFDRAGRPSAAQTLTLAGGTQIFVESETGYVHD